MGKREDLQRAIERAERELARLDALPDFSDMCDGSIVAMVVEQWRNVHSYVGLKTDGRWSLTGGGPNDVSDSTLEEWLTTGGRNVLSANNVGQISNPYRGVPAVNTAGPDGSLLDSVSESRRWTGSMGEDVCRVPDCGCSGTVHP